MSSAGCSNEVADEEVRETKKLKTLSVDELQTKTDEELEELISTNKRNIGLLELVLPNKAQALKEAIRSYEDEILRRATNLSHCPKVIRVEGGDQIVAENENSDGYICVEERAESRDTVGTNVVNVKQVIKVEVGDQSVAGNENSYDGFTERETVGTNVVELKVLDFSTEKKVEMNVPKELKPKQHQQQTQQPEQETSQRSGKQHQVSQSLKKRTHKKKSGGEKKTCNKQLWSPKEEAWLATCWCDTSEDSIVGNSQKRGTFWGMVEEKFMANNHGWIRGADQLSSKWRKINNTCKNFNAIYDSAYKAWGSSRDDNMVYEQALAEYYDTYTKTFNMRESWLAMKDHPKWKVPPLVGGTGLRDEEDDFFNDSVDISAENHISLPNELFGPDPLPQPMGRNKAWKTARSSVSSDATTSSRISTPNSKMDEMMENIANYKQEMLAARKQAIETFTRQEKLRTAMQGAQFLTLNTSNITDPEDLAAVRRMKKTIRKEFREFYEAEDEDDEDED